MIHYQDRWAVVTGASSGFGQVFATRLANRGMSLVLSGRDEAGLEHTADLVRDQANVKVEIVASDLSTASGVAALLDHVGERPIEVLINNAGFGTFGPFTDADPERESDELAVDVTAVVTLAQAFLPGMVARGSGGILNVASTIAFQPAPYQAVYGASKAFVLSFSQALWAESRGAGVAVTALCPGPTRTGFVDALGGDAGHTAIYRRLADPEPVVDAGLRALGHGRAVVTPGLRNKLLAFSGRFTPREWLTLLSGRLLRPERAAPRPPIEVRNEIVVNAPPERVWDLLTDVAGWPSWYQACRWVDLEATGSFRWKAHPVVLRSRIIESERPNLFTYAADSRGLHAEHSFSLCPTADGRSTLVVSHETQTGLLPRLGRAVLARQLLTTDRAWLVDLAAASGRDGAPLARATASVNGGAR